MESGTLRRIFLETDILAWLPWKKSRRWRGEQWKCVFMHNLSLHVDAGIDLSRALQFCIKGVPRIMKRPAKKIVEAIDEGRPLAESLETHVPAMLPRPFYRIIDIGEQSGGLSHALKIVDRQLSELLVRKRRVAGALIYPSMIIMTSSGIMLFLLLRVLPTMAEIFEYLNASLPARTQALITLSSFIRSHALMVCLLLTGTLAGIYAFVHISRKIGFLGRLFIHIPYVGTLVYHEHNMLFSMLMSMLLGMGTPIREALLLCESDAVWAYYRQGIARMRRDVSEGKALSESIGNQKEFSPTFRWLISVGDHNGDMAAMLDAVGEYESEYIKNKVLMIHAIFEPILLLCNSAAVGIMVTVMWFPLTDMTDLI